MTEKRDFTNDEVLAMREKLLRLMGANSSAYPHAVEKEYPRILAKLVEVWDTPELAKYLDDLTFSTRGGRAGFHGAVANELFNLSTLYSVPPESSMPEAKGWNSGTAA